MSNPAAPQFPNQPVPPQQPQYSGPAQQWYPQQGMPGNPAPQGTPGYPKQPGTPPAPRTPWHQRRITKVSVFLAVLTTGLLAGLYYAYSCSVMIALGNSDDRTFDVVMDKINTAIVNPWFMLSFLGSILFSGVALVLDWRGSARWWLLAATVFNVLSFLITSGIEIPLNNQLAAAMAAHGPIDFAAVRHNFESSWVGWNLVRALANTVAFGTLIWAIMRRRAQ